MTTEQKLIEMLLELNDNQNYNRVCSKRIDDNNLRIILNDDGGQDLMLFSRIMGVTSNMSYVPIFDAKGNIIEQRLCKNIFDFATLIKVLDDNYYGWDLNVILYPNLYEHLKVYRANINKKLKINNLTLDEQKTLLDLSKPLELNKITIDFSDNSACSQMYIKKYGYKIKERIEFVTHNFIKGEFKDYVNGLLYSKLSSMSESITKNTIIIKQRVQQGSVLYDISDYYNSELCFTLTYDELNNIIAEVTKEANEMLSQLHKDCNVEQSLQTIDELYSKFIGEQHEVN